MRQTGVIALLVVLALGACGCSAPTTSDRDLVFVDPQQAADLLGGRQRLFGLAGTDQTAIVDVRSRDDFEAGHLPGAFNIPFQYVSRDYEQLRDFKVIVVYGSGPDDRRADAMSKRLIEKRFSDVRTLRGGVRAWLNAGFVLETDESVTEGPTD
ncbi:MAG: rhodanese-like domain-containing protein [Planctomycetota bacterium]|jgi:rhodanese-related sulfurtransferase